MKVLQRCWRALGLLSLVMWGACLGADWVRPSRGAAGIAVDVTMILLMGFIMWTELKEPK